MKFKLGLDHWITKLFVLIYLSFFYVYFYPESQIVGIVEFVKPILMVINYACAILGTLLCVGAAVAKQDLIDRTYKNFDNSGTYILSLTRVIEYATILFLAAVVKDTHLAFSMAISAFTFMYFLSIIKDRFMDGQAGILNEEGKNE